MRVEEKYIDVLQSIELAIVRVYQENPDISDYTVMRTLEALIDTYSGEKIGRPPRNFKLSEEEREVMDSVYGMCEWRLGRGELYISESVPIVVTESELVTLDEIIVCLKRILKSVNYWNKEGGRQGYLDFIIQYLM